MSTQSCRTVFDLAATGYSAWSAVGTGAGVAVASAAILLVLTRAFGMSRIPARLWFAPVFAGALTIVGFLTTWRDYRQALTKLQSGGCEKVEGMIENFVPCPITGHSPESFTVAGHRFEYSDFNMTPGFRRSRARGGPFGPGVYVRLRFTGNDILYAEICDPAIVTHDHARWSKPRGQDYDGFTNNCATDSRSAIREAQGMPYFQDLIGRSNCLRTLCVRG